MAIGERLTLYKKIEAKRGNPLIVYATSQRQGASGMMASDVIDEFIDQIETARKDNKSENIDLLIESTGGDALTAWRIVSLLRSSFKKVNVLIPHSAFSAATLLSLGADEIVMGSYGSLGPIDPQIQSVKKDGTVQSFGYEDVASFISFVKEEGGITEQAYLKEALDKLCETVDPSVLGFAKRSSSLSVSIGARMLQMHMSDPEKKAQAHAIATKLNKSFFNHGHALSREEAADIGLNIVKPDADLESAMWAVHADIEKELETRKPFDPLAVYLAHPDAAALLLQSPPPIHIPPQIDQQVALQLMQAYLMQQVNVRLPVVESEVKYGFLESVRHASENFVKGSILIERTGDLQFKGNMVPLGRGWRNVTIETTPTPTPTAAGTAGEGAAA